MTNRELAVKIEQLTKRLEEIEKKKKHEKALYSVEEVAKRLGVTREAVYQIIKRQEIPAIKFGTIKIRAVDIEKIVGSTL